MGFDMIIWNKNMVKKENCVKRIQKLFFIVYIKTENMYKDIAADVETRFDTSNYELDRPSIKRSYKKVTGLMKNELGETIIANFVGLRAKTYNYLRILTPRMEELALYRI